MPAASARANGADELRGMQHPSFWLTVRHIANHNAHGSLLDAEIDHFKALGRHRRGQADNAMLWPQLRFGQIGSDAFCIVKDKER